MSFASAIARKSIARDFSFSDLDGGAREGFLHARNSDAPAVVDGSGAEIGKFYRPTKKPVTMRLDSDVIAWLKADGRGYQSKRIGFYDKP